MRCPNHPQNDATGYCSVCGAFGCQECLTLHEGNLLCERHYRPIARKVEEEKKQEQIRKHHPRQRLVVRYLDGHCDYGVSFAMNLKEPGFHLNLVDASGAAQEKAVYVRFQDVKAVFLVKSFDGNFDKTIKYKEWTPEGRELVVCFKDGEVIRGFSLHRYDPNEPRFHLIPADFAASNNVSVLVELRAVEGVYLPEEYKAKKVREREAQGVTAPAGPTQEETTGDFYFETRNYPAALEQYRLAASKYAPSTRVQKKILVALFNVGLHHIKRHEYEKALLQMEAALKMDPQNERIRKKVSQLHHIIEKTKARAAVAPRRDEIQP